MTGVDRLAVVPSPEAFRLPTSDLAKLKADKKLLVAETVDVVRLCDALRAARQS